MNAQGLFSIGGIASGLDTAGIIEQLMQLERQPVVRMQNTQKQLESVDKAWQSINIKLSSLRTAVDKIRRPDRFNDLVAVSSSNADAVGVSKASVAQTGSLTFHVDQLAQAHQLASGTFASATDALGTAGTLSVTVGGEAFDVAVAATDSLDDLASQLNDLDGGFSASVVRTGEGEHRLVLDSTSSGVANAMIVTSDTGLTQFAAYDAATNPSGLRTLQAAQDAHVRMGTGAEAIVIARSSNTITDLVPGASVTLKNVTDGNPVTVTAKRDVDGAVSAVKSYVDALNGVIDTVAGLTSYNAQTKTSGALQGDPSARQLLDNLRSAATSPLGAQTGTFSGSFDIGISLDRYGKVVVDETKLKAALNKDFDGVGQVMSRNASAGNEFATATVGTSKTAAGRYQVRVDSAARAAQAIGGVVGPPGGGDPKYFRITSGGKSVDITIHTDGRSAASIVAEINDKLAAEGISSITADVDASSQLTLTESRYGTAAAFDVEAIDAEGGATTGDTTFFGQTSFAGEDAVAVWGVDDGVNPIDWQPMTAVGRQLSVASGVAEGLSLTWTGDGPASAFGVTFTHGLGGSVDKVLTSAEGSFGLVARARKGIADQIDVYQTRIDSFEQRLLTRESTLVKQFTAMEVALSNMQAQGSWLTSQLSSLNGLSQQPQ